MFASQKIAVHYKSRGIQILKKYILIFMTKNTDFHMKNTDCVQHGLASLEVLQWPFSGSQHCRQFQRCIDELYNGEEQCLQTVFQQLDGYWVQATQFRFRTLQTFFNLSFSGQPQFSKFMHKLSDVESSARLSSILQIFPQPCYLSYEKNH